MTTDTTHLDQLGGSDTTEAWDELEDVSAEFANIRPTKDRQLNLRVSDELLAQLREVAAAAGKAYHSLARQLIEEGLARVSYQPSSEAAFAPAARPFRMKEVLLVMLGAPGSEHVDNEEVVGATRLQKLLFLVAQHLKPNVADRFEAFDYGPFDEFVEPDLEFLANEGLVERSGHESLQRDGRGPGPTGAELLAWVRERNVPPASQVERYRLTQLGMEWFRRFLTNGAFGSPEAKQALLAECARLKEQFGDVPLDDLLAHVYSEHPEYTSESKIRHQVAERANRGRTSSP